MARRGKKKIVEWDYDPDGVGLKIPVYMTESAGELQFRVSLSEPEIERWHSDINILKDIVFKELKEKLAIDWRNMLQVEVDGDYHELSEYMNNTDYASSSL